jgi:hypothetical protein
MKSPRACSLRSAARLSLSSAITRRLRLPGSRVTCAFALLPVLVGCHFPCVRSLHASPGVVRDRLQEDSRVRLLLGGDVSMPAPCRRSTIACIPARLALPWNSAQPSFVELLFLIDRATTVTLFPRKKIHFFEIFSSYDALWCVSYICSERTESAEPRCAPLARDRAEMRSVCAAQRRFTFRIATTACLPSLPPAPHKTIRSP